MSKNRELMKTDTPMKNLAIMAAIGSGGLTVAAGATYGLGYILAFLWNAGIAPLHWEIPYITAWTGFIFALVPMLFLFKAIDKAGD